MKIRNKLKLRNFFKASGVTVLVTLILGIGVLTPITLIKTNSNIIALIVSTRNNPFFADIISGAQNAISVNSNYELRIFDSNGSDNEQVRNIDSAISIGAKAVIINVVNSETGANAGISKLLDINIPVVAVDRGVENANVDLTIASDNIAGSRDLANSFKNKILDKNFENKILLKNNSIFQLQGQPGSQSSLDRNKGFGEIFGNSIANKVIANFSRPQAFTATSSFLAKDGPKNTKVIFAENDEMALGAIQALRSPFMPWSLPWTTFNDGRVYVMGFDGTTDALESIKNNEMYSTVIQEPTTMGEIAISELFKYFNTNSFESSYIPSPTTVVDKDNVGEFLIK